MYESIPVNLRVPSENTLNRTVRWNTNRRMNTIPAVAKLDFSGSHRNSWTVKTLPAIGHGGFVEDTIRRAQHTNLFQLGWLSRIIRANRSAVIGLLLPFQRKKYKYLLELINLRLFAIPNTVNLILNTNLSFRRFVTSLLFQALL